MLRLLAFLAGLLFAGAALAQTSPPLVFNLTAQAAGTVTSPDQQNLLPGTAILRCTFNQTAHTGTPSTTFSIQGRDEAGSANYYTILTSAAITADSTPTPIVIGPGVSVVANQSSGIPVPRAWRVSATVGGTTPSVTATIACAAR